jgi:hypothetical protein
MTLFPEHVTVGLAALRLGVSEDVVRAVVSAFNLPTEQLVDLEQVRAHLRQRTVDRMPDPLAAQEKSRGGILDPGSRW